MSTPVQPIAGIIRFGVPYRHRSSHETAYIFNKLKSFARFQSLRKNQLLAFYDVLKPILDDVASCEAVKAGPARDYYFLAQFEAGQKELVDAHHYTYAIDLFGIGVRRRYTPRVCRS